MDAEKLWLKLRQEFRLTPEDYGLEKGEATEGPYRHSTSILGIAFNSDDSYLALAGGGCLPGTDGSIRIIEVATQKNVFTLHAHVCGVHAVAIDPATDFIASASFDYAAHLWNVEVPDVIFLRGEDSKTKGFCEFTPQGSLLAIGEYAYYEGPHSFYVYDIKSQKKVFEQALPDELGVTSLTFSPDSTYLAVTACDRNQSRPSQFYLVQLGSFEIVRTHTFEGIGFYDLAFVGGHDRLLAAVDGWPIEGDSGLIEIDAHTGEIHWAERIEGIGAKIAVHPQQDLVAVGLDEAPIRLYSPGNWSVIREIPWTKDTDDGRFCSITWSHNGKLLAYGLSNGRFDILSVGKDC